MQDPVQELLETPMEKLPSLPETEPTLNQANKNDKMERQLRPCEVGKYGAIPLTAIDQVYSHMMQHSSAEKQTIKMQDPLPKICSRRQ